MASYQFDKDFAKKFGVEEAIMFHNIKYWVGHNKDNNINFHDGKHWTYNSISAFLKQFPFWSKKQIERILSNLFKNNLILKGNFNSTAYDRTSWYALVDEALYLPVDETGKCISPNGEMEDTEQENGIPESGEPIPDSNTDSNTNEKPNDISIPEELDLKAAKKKEERENALEVLDHLNKICQKNFKPTKANIEFITGRFKDSFTIDELKLVVEFKAKGWLNNLEYNQYLQPSTLFGVKKCDGYLQAAIQDQQRSGGQRTIERTGIIQNQTREDFTSENKLSNDDFWSKIMADKQNGLYE